MLTLESLGFERVTIKAGVVHLLALQQLSVGLILISGIPALRALLDRFLREAHFVLALLDHSSGSRLN